MVAPPRADASLESEALLAAFRDDIAALRRQGSKRNVQRQRMGGVWPASHVDNFPRSLRSRRGAVSSCAIAPRWRAWRVTLLPGTPGGATARYGRGRWDQSRRIEERVRFLEASWKDGKMTAYRDQAGVLSVSAFG